MSEGLLRLEDALDRMLEGVAARATEDVTLGAALGRVLAEEVRARDALPPWDDSAMDGSAVRSEDVAAASADRPVVLRVVGEVAAGHAADASVTPGTALRILTGAALPRGADAVVRVEDTDAPAGVAALPARVGIRVAVPPGAAVRPAGSAMRAGDRVMVAGTAIAPRHVAALAAAGRATVRVWLRPRVAILATGDELVPPGAPLEGARIPDSSSPGIAAQVAEAGGVPVPLGIAPDDRDATGERLRAGNAPGRTSWWCRVSVGAHDEVRPALDDVGRG
ncbi:MAG: molybdopterin molybdotransferase MoeA [Chloroflexota bacterium]